MNLDRPFTPTIADHIAIETDEDRAQADQRRIDGQLEQSGVRRVRELLDGEMMQRAVTLSPDKIAAMNRFERRYLLDWIVARANMLEEKSALLSRHIVKSAEVPQFIRMAGGA